MDQYYRATGDATISSDTSYQTVVFGLADFWISRVKFNNSTQLYEIIGRSDVGTNQLAVPPNVVCLGIAWCYRYNV